MSERPEHFVDAFTVELRAFNREAPKLVTDMAEEPGRMNEVVFAGVDAARRHHCNSGFQRSVRAFDQSDRRLPVKAPAIAEVCDEIRSHRAAADHDDPVQPVALELGEPDLALRMHGRRGLPMVRRSRHFRRGSRFPPVEIDGKRFVPGQILPLDATFRIELLNCLDELIDKG